MDTVDVYVNVDVTCYMNAVSINYANTVLICNSRRLRASFSKINAPGAKEVTLAFIFTGHFHCHSRCRDRRLLPSFMSLNADEAQWYSEFVQVFVRECREQDLQASEVAELLADFSASEIFENVEGQVGHPGGFGDGDDTCQETVSTEKDTEHVSSEDEE